MNDDTILEDEHEHDGDREHDGHRKIEWRRRGLQRLRITLVPALNLRDWQVIDVGADDVDGVGVRLGSGTLRGHQVRLAVMSGRG
jgi:hypothetical protein